ncbi:monocyte chemotactic protein 1B-like [Dunckerocampus dactyliophorus]|uniref:monocyte chemotactic protein 1B-like n=1 Tax=Dunckerocampus dactyliophorus TaxID=161453 RepID=UPI00240531CD|nr:monocyte chemotactic protein 1B-like [Dunckerocampus dactyliophorus]
MMAAVNLVSLFLLTVMVSGALAQGRLADCCRRIKDTQIHRDLLTKYYVQRPPSCSLQAVVFSTVQGKRICADPDKLWTQTSMAYLDGKNCHVPH